MGMSVQILAKFARNAQIQGLVVSSQTATAVVIANGANALTVSYQNAQIQMPQGGVDPSVSPYLGIGVANPGKIVLQSATGTTIPTLIDGVVAAQVFALLAAFANDIILMSDDGVTQLAVIKGTSDWIGMGQ
jgi:hypothetical protein